MSIYNQAAIFTLFDMDSRVYVRYNRQGDVGLTTRLHAGGHEKGIGCGMDTAILLFVHSSKCSNIPPGQLQFTDCKNAPDVTEQSSLKSSLCYTPHTWCFGQRSPSPVMSAHRCDSFRAPRLANDLGDEEFIERRQRIPRWRTQNQGTFSNDLFSVSLDPATQSLRDSGANSPATPPPPQQLPTLQLLRPPSSPIPNTFGAGSSGGIGSTPPNRDSEEMGSIVEQEQEQEAQEQDENSDLDEPDELGGGHDGGSADPIEYVQAEEEYESDGSDYEHFSIHDQHNHEVMTELSHLLKTLVYAKISQATINTILQSPALRHNSTFDRVDGYVRRRCGLESRYAPMCRAGHMAATGVHARQRQCRVSGCDSVLGRSRRYWYSLVSDQLTALCGARDSFQELMAGCRRARDAIKNPNTPYLDQYYDGETFKRLYGNDMKNWNEDSELYVFLTFSTDGFKVFEGRKQRKEAWPLAFMILNLADKHKYRAANVMKCAFIPGSHAPEYFDSFLYPIIVDIVRLEAGVDVLCADGKLRKLYVYVLFITADWPGASKVLGFSGHNALVACRFCLKISRYITEVHSTCMLPNTQDSLRQEVIGGSQPSALEWLETECPNRRSSTETAFEWNKIDRALRRGDRQTANEITRSKGIRRKPLISALKMDYVNSFPYDPMHQGLLGWVHHLLMLSSGLHKRCKLPNAHYSIRSERVDQISEVLNNAKSWTPSSWGRHPMGLADLNKYKAEDLKMFGIYYGFVVFRGCEIDVKVTKMWALTSKMLSIVFDPSPRKDDILSLQIVVAKLNALLRETFYAEERDSFCFTPTTHAILHLPDMLRECGPLVGVSQFTMERLVGEAGETAKSRRFPESNMFHHSQLRFALQIIDGGLSSRINYTKRMREGRYESRSGVITGTNEEFHEEVKVQVVFGPGVNVAGTQRLVQAKCFITDALLSVHGHCVVSISALRNLKRVTVIEHDEALHFETMSAYRLRNQRQPDGARQQFCVAAEFEMGSTGVSDIRTYYGCVDELWDVTFQYNVVSSSSVHRTSITLARVLWDYGLRRDEYAEAVYSNISARRNALAPVTPHASVEHISSLDRQISCMQSGVRRYYFDQKSHVLRQCVGDRDVRIGGILQAPGSSNVNG